MNITTRLVIASAFLVLLFAPAVWGDAEESPIGKPISDFQLPSNLGISATLSDWKDKPVVAIVFLSTNARFASSTAQGWQN